MAGNKNSGGMRPTAPQNNPANVSATGGNGQSGQAKPGYTGFAYGQNGALDAQAGAAKMQGAPASVPAPKVSGPSLMDMAALHESQPSGVPITDGVDFGPGRGSDALPKNLNPDRRVIENADLIARYLPDLINATRVQNAPDSYKRFINKLKGML
jgi:hypothetical protein